MRPARRSSVTYHPELLTYTGDQLRAKAAESSRRSAESFERSDTDGFLSQWASDSMAALYTRAADLADDGWTGIEYALFDLDGHLLPARNVPTPYGWSWVMDTEDGTKWINESEARDLTVRRRNNERKGIRVGQIRVAAVPVTVSTEGSFQLANTWRRDKDRPEVCEVITADLYGDMITEGKHR